MIKQILRVVLCAGVLLIAVGCGGTKTIPDTKLRGILKEIYLSNAYVSTNAWMRGDTVDIYTPILKKYGYTANDFKQTIAGYSRRKSARFSDMIESTLKEMEAEYALLEAGVAKLDTVDARAGRRFSRVVYSADSIRVRKVSDTSRLRIVIDPALEGRYMISYVYKRDTLDKNTSVRATHNTYDSSGMQQNYDSQWFSPGDRKRYSTKVETNNKVHKMVLQLGNYQKDMKRPHLDIDSLKVVYFLPTKVAIDSINKILVDYKLMINDKEWPVCTKDSSALHTHSPRAIAGASGEPR